MLARLIDRVSQFFRPTQPNRTESLQAPVPLSSQNCSPVPALLSGPSPSNQLALWKAGIAVQTGQLSEAREVIHGALASGASRGDIAQILIGSVHASLGRASSFSGAPDKALHHFTQAQDLQTPGAEKSFNDLLSGHAKLMEARGDFRNACLAWQDLACLMGADTPDHIYAALSQAQRHVRDFGGSSAENHCWGDLHKHDVLSQLHEQLEPSFYLEVGVDEGLSLARATGPAVGLDPRPHLTLKRPPPKAAAIVCSSSDRFFRELAPNRNDPPIDLAFIDGMHLFEFVLRDFINVEQHASEYGLVVIDDVFPCHPKQAKRHRESGSWTGDVWKIQRVLKSYRPDLFLMRLNCWTTGLLLVAGLDSNSSVLRELQSDITRKFRVDSQVPASVLEREGAIPSDHPIVGELCALLLSARRESWSRNQLSESLSALQAKLSEVEREFAGRAKGLANPDAHKSKLWPQA